MELKWYEPLAWGICVCVGLYFGHKAPRDVELQSTAPVYFVLNADAQAAKILVEQCKPAEDR